VQIVATLHYLGNDDKEKDCIIQYRCKFFLNIFSLQLVDSMDMEPRDTEVQCILWDFYGSGLR
jgi:hypothetical protein